jgi:hypothetical protein
MHLIDALVYGRYVSGVLRQHKRAHQQAPSEPYFSYEKNTICISVKIAIGQLSARGVFGQWARQQQHQGCSSPTPTITAAVSTNGQWRPLT